MIVVTGEALVDLVLHAGGDLAAHPGGGPYNVARTIARLEQPVAYLGRLSDDRFGARLRAGLEADGVQLTAVVDTDDPTTLALAELDDRGAATYRFYADGTSAPGLTADDVRLPEGARAFYLGTLGLVFEPMASALEEALGRVDDDVLVALDPNCRPAVIDDPAGYRARLGRLAQRADVVKASEEDLEWLAPGAAPADAARKLLAAPGAVAIVTLGGDGALVVGASGEAAVAAPAVEVVDTIGAGDAFMGAFLARWLGAGRGRSELADLDAVAEAAGVACRVAAITCSRAGADPPRLAEL